MMTGNQLQWSTVPYRPLSANKVLIFLDTAWHKATMLLPENFCCMSGCQATSAYQAMTGA